MKYAYVYVYLTSVKQIGNLVAWSASLRIVYPPVKSYTWVWHKLINTYITYNWQNAKLHFGEEQASFSDMIWPTAFGVSWYHHNKNIGWRWYAKQDFLCKNYGLYLLSTDKLQDMTSYICREKGSGSRRASRRHAGRSQITLLWPWLEGGISCCHMHTTAS